MQNWPFSKSSIKDTTEIATSLKEKSDNITVTVFVAVIAKY